MTDNWLPASSARFGKAATASPGALVIFPPLSKERRFVAPGIRFDIVDKDDGEKYESVFWLQGWPHGPDTALRNVSKCRDFHLNDDLVMIVEPSSSIKIELELSPDCAGRPGYELNWGSADGAIASGPFGMRIAANASLDQYGRNALAIDPWAWRSDNQALRQAVGGWFARWQIRVWDGQQRTYATYRYESPSIELACSQT